MEDNGQARKEAKPQENTDSMTQETGGQNREATQQETKAPAEQPQAQTQQPRQQARQTPPAKPQQQQSQQQTPEAAQQPAASQNDQKAGEAGGKNVLGRGIDALIPPKAAESVLEGAAQKQDPASDGELKAVLARMDDLLGKLPDDVIAEFSNSGDFELYDRILKRYGAAK